MDPWGDGVRHRGAATAALARAAALVAPPSGALGLSVQGQRVPSRWPLILRPRHYWPHDHLATMGPPLLRRKWLGLVKGSLSLFRGREPPYRRHGQCSEQ